MTVVPPGVKAHNLFEVYLRLRPPQAGAVAADRFLEVEPPETDAPSTAPTHIRLNPPNDRRRAIEKFCFTQVFEEDATQLDIFQCTGVVPLVEGVLAPLGGEGTDALFATLGVTGSGKSHTILGSRSQRGLTQLVLDVLFRSIGENIADGAPGSSLEASISATDASEATIYTAATYLDLVYADMSGPSRYSSRAPTPIIVRTAPSPASEESFFSAASSLHPSEHPEVLRGSSDNRFSSVSMPGRFPSSPSGLPKPRHKPESVRIVRREDYVVPPEIPPSWGACSNSELWQSSWQTKAHGPFIPPMSKTPRASRHFMVSTAASAKHKKTANAKAATFQGEHAACTALPPPPTPRRFLNRRSAFPQQPDISGVQVNSDPAAEYAVLISMYEVYNDRIFDLLTPPMKSAATKEYRRRPLLFKSTEASPDRKVVAGLRKIICSGLQQALHVLEAGLHERRVAGTGSNSVSSRSHGFVCIEVKKRSLSHRGIHTPWSGNTLTVVDLAGSERARDAKTAGTTLAEAGKINESLMYLGQCLQMQSDAGSSSKPSVVPFRQCKLTELLFSNSFPSASMAQSTRRNPQRAVMIVTADPQGDFNATSQILRYSALAREVTVPRIPSITQTLMGTSQTAVTHQGAPGSASAPFPAVTMAANGGHMVHHHRPFCPPGSASSQTSRTFSPMSNASSEDRVTMELAALEIARLSEEVDFLRASLDQESERRMEAESHLLLVTDRMLELEQEIRENCAVAFDERLAVEMSRWKASLEVEKERSEEHWDRKVDVMERLQSTADENNGDGCGAEDKENVLVENLEEENDRLRREVMVLKRELAGRSPVKRKPLREREDVLTAAATSPCTSGTLTPGSASLDLATESMRRKMEQMRMSEADAVATESILGRGSPRPSGASFQSMARNGSPKKMHKMSARKWDLALDDDVF